MRKFSDKFCVVFATLMAIVYLVSFPIFLYHEAKDSAPPSTMNITEQAPETAIELPMDLSLKDIEMTASGSVYLLLGERSVHDVPHTYYYAAVDKDNDVKTIWVFQEN